MNTHSKSINEAYTLCHYRALWLSNVRCSPSDIFFILIQGLGHKCKNLHIGPHLAYSESVISNVTDRLERALRTYTIKKLLFIQSLERPSSPYTPNIDVVLVIQWDQRRPRNQRAADR
jgi:hypothetical protein